LSGEIVSAEKKTVTEVTAEPVPAPEESSGAAENTPGTDDGQDIENLARGLEEWRTKADEYRNDMLRMRAEMDNLRKRTQRDIENAHKYGQERLIQELLPVKDSMELGLAAAQTVTEVATIRAGMELTLKLLNTALEKLNVAEVDPVGEKFNPDLHQAISTQLADAEPGTVLNVVQKGYILNGRLLRPAMVVVARTRAE
jgi:molecular chaperone GrpE